MKRNALIFIVFLGVVSFMGPLGLAQDSSIQIVDVEGPGKKASLRLTLKDCLQMALANNAKLAAKDYNIEASEWRYKESQMRFMPILEYTNRSAPVPRDAANAAESFFSGDVTYMNATKVGVGFPVYGFGQLDKVQEIAIKGIEGAKMEKAKDEVKLVSDIKQLYYAILLSGDLAGLTQEAVHKIDTQLRTEEKDHVHSPYEVLRIRVFKSDLEKRLEEAKTRGALARRALTLQMGLGDSESFEMALTNLEPVTYDLKALDTYKSDAVDFRPESRLVDIGVEAKRLEYELEKKKLLPRLGVGGFFEIARTATDVSNVNTSDEFLNPFNYTRAGVGMELKGTIDFHAARSRIRRLDSEYQKASIERSLAKQGMELEVEEAYGEVLRLKGNMMHAEEKQKLARQMMFLSKSNLDIGVGQEQEYTDSLQLVLLTEGEYLKSVFEYNVSIAKLEEKLGRRNHATTIQ
ncbi:MAG: TolC family protein [Deltaproteobacteria bacterium]|nr:TolC family protein [Deltaproteobacteria bacterium]